METQVGWYIPQKVIYFIYPQKLSVEMLENLLDKVTQMLNEVDHPIYVISNTTILKSYPVSIHHLKSVIMLIKHPNYIAININTNRAITFMSSIVPKMLGTNLQVKDVPNIEKAIDYIKSKDSSIDWTLANKSVLLSEAYH